MRVVMLQAPESLLIERRRLGHDRRDEMWEGELHMVPPPHVRHQRLNDRLGAFFLIHWEALGLGKTCPETGVKRPGSPLTKVAGEDVPVEYRTPDRSFLLPERYDRIQGGWIVGGPDVVIEILSPGDESRAKLSFYFSVGVREAILIGRDDYEVEIFRAGASELERVTTPTSRWVQSDVLRTELRCEKDAEGSPLLRVRRSDEPSRELVIRD